MSRGHKLTSAPIAFIHAVMQACSALIRLLKTSAARYLDTEAAKASLFLGIELARQMSVRHMDLPDKTRRIMTLLWSSEKVFKDQHGAPVTTLRVRSRSSASHIFDVIWWWKDEYESFENLTASLNQQSTGKWNEWIIYRLYAHIACSYQWRTKIES